MRAWGVQMLTARHLLPRSLVSKLRLRQKTGGSVNVKVQDLMTASVTTIDRSTSVDGARRLLEDHGIGAVPVVNQIGEPVGIVSSTDLIRDLDPGAPV